MKVRNYVALALLKRGGGTRTHNKTRKALRRAAKIQTSKGRNAS